MSDIETYGFSPNDVANWFICNIDREAGDAITHLKLQKMRYYAQAWTIVLNKKSLFEEDFEAWAHGPVLPTIYEQYRTFSFDALPNCECDNSITDEVESVLDEVKRIYGEKSAKSLENLTHEETPWLIARGDLPSEARCNKKITKKSLQKYYSNLLEEVNV